MVPVAVKALVKVVNVSANKLTTTTKGSIVTTVILTLDVNPVGVFNYPKIKMKKL
jgi:hypothetical protein